MKILIGALAPTLSVVGADEFGHGMDATHADGIAVHGDAHVLDAALTIASKLKNLLIGFRLVLESRLLEAAHLILGNLGASVHRALERFVGLRPPPRLQLAFTAQSQVDCGVLILTFDIDKILLKAPLLGGGGGRNQRRPLTHIQATLGFKALHQAQGGFPNGYKSHTANLRGAPLQEAESPFPEIAYQGFGGAAWAHWKASPMAKLNKKELEWLEVRQRYSLTHAQVQMARELELIPRSLAKLTDPPVPVFIERQYLEQFGRPAPRLVTSIEDRAKQEQKDNALEKLERKKLPKKAAAPDPPPAKPQKRKKNRPHVSIPPRGRG